MAPAPTSGRLDETPVPRLLLDLQADRFTGELLLERDRTAKRVLFHEGSPVAAESNLASESLGVLLLDSGRLSREDYARVVGLVQLKKCKEGKALLDLKLLGPKDLFLALKEQLRRRILECFAWPHGEFTLDPAVAPPEDAKSFRLDPIALAQQGIETHWSPERTLAALGAKAARYALPTPKLAHLADRLTVDAAGERLLAAIDGSRTLGECLHLAASPSALAAAWVLDAAGAVTLADAPQRRAGGKPEDDAPEIEICVEGAEAGRGSAAAERGASAKTSAGADGGEAEKLRAEIQERHRGLGTFDHYALLGVPRKADAGAIKRAYFAAAKRYHPDALGRLGLDDVRREANELFAAIARAHAVLSDPAERREYDASTDGGGDLESGDRAARAEGLFRKGDILVRKGAFGEAIQYLRPAVELWPDEGTYRSAFGWALYKKTPAEPEPAREQLERAVKLDPKDGVTHYRLGVVLRALGEKEAAEKALARAKALEPAPKAGAPVKAGAAGKR